MRNPRLLAISIAAVLLTASPCVSGQAAGSTQERDRLWVAIRDTMRARIATLSDYTCIQTSTRFEQAQNEKQERYADTIRMQVTAAAGNESYSWPGSPNTAERPSDLVRTGLLGTGAFQGYSHALFVGPGPSQIEYLGKDTSAGQPLLHFRFTFDLRERMILHVAAGRASVAAKGEFWADERDHTVRRMRIESADSAPEINVKSAEYTFDWAPVLLHGRRVSLPQASSMRLEMFSGEVRRNVITLSQCREFGAESAIRFDAPPEPAAPPATATGLEAAGFLPAGLSVRTRLLSALDNTKLAVGDPFEAEIARDVQWKRTTLLRKGDRAEGRIRYLATNTDPEVHTLLWLEIATIRSGDKEYIFLGEMTRAAFATNIIHQAQGFTEGRLERIGVMGSYRIDRREFRSYGSAPGVASLLFRGDRAALPEGYEITWSTLPARTDDGR